MTGHRKLKVVRMTLHKLASTQSAERVTVNRLRTVKEAQRVKRSTFPVADHVVNVGDHADLTGTDGGAAAILLATEGVRAEGAGILRHCLFSLVRVLCLCHYLRCRGPLTVSGYARIIHGDR